MSVPKPPPPPNPPEWASYVAGRRPQHKLHTKRGFAFNAVMTYRQTGNVMFHWENDDWVEVFIVPDFDVITCEYCNLPFTRSLYGRREVEHVRHDKNDIYDIHWYHPDCTPRRRAYREREEQRKIKEAKALLRQHGEL